MNGMIVLGDRILVKPKEEATTTESGIILVSDSSSKDVPMEGTVIDIGKDVDNVSKGNIIIFPKYVGIPITIANEDYIAIRSEEVIVIVGQEGV